jgi:hypothetical protein
MHWRAFIGRCIHVVAERGAECHFIALGDIDLIDKRWPEIATSCLE